MVCALPVVLPKGVGWNSRCCSVPPHAFVAGITVVIDTAAIAATLSQTIDGKFMCKATAVGAAGYSAQCLLMPETCRKMYWTYVRPAASPARAARATC